MNGPEAEAVERSIRAGTYALWLKQCEDGSLPSDNHGGAIYTGLYLATFAWLGVLTDREAREGTRWLMAQQDAETGAFSATPTSGIGSVDATWCAVIGLEAAGAGGAEAAARARRWLGPRLPGAFFAPLLGLHDPKLCPWAPLDWVTLPVTRDWAWRRFHPWMTLAMLTGSAISHGLRNAPEPWHTRRGAAQVAAVEALSAVQNPCGSWVGALLFTLSGVAALRLLGVPHKDGRVQRAVDWARGWRMFGPEGLEVMPFSAGTWNTARGLRASLMARLPASDPRLRDAARWLVSAQHHTPGPPGWQNNAEGAPTSGGWSYESASVTTPDVDTTAAVLSALGPFVAATGDAAGAASIQRGAAWLLGLQNPDGGFPAFRRGLGVRVPGPMFLEPVGMPTTLRQAARLLLDPPQELLDPSTGEVTGRVLTGLAAVDAPAARLAAGAAFIREVQWHDRWFGRWDCNYQAGTSYALSGLAAAGATDRDPAVRAGLDWLLRKQNPDGGFGEDILTYRKGCSDDGPFPSRADLTGTVLIALVDCGRRDSAAAHAAAAHLVRAQRPDGTWGGPMPLYVVLPPDEFYSNPIASLAAPIEALGRYLHG